MSDNAQDKQNAFLSHLLGIFMILGPLIFWLVKKGESEVAAREAKKCLNFQITAFLAIVVLVIVGTILGIVLGSIAPALAGLVGMVVMLVYFVIWIGQLILVIINAIKANKGEPTGYPFSLNLIK